MILKRRSPQAGPQCIDRQSVLLTLCAALCLLASACQREAEHALARGDSPTADQPAAASPSTPRPSLQDEPQTPGTEPQTGVEPPTGKEPRTAKEQPLRPLEGSHASLEALIESVLDALERKDHAALIGLAVSKEEWIAYLYPEFAVAKRGSNKPPELLWQLQAQRSHVGARRAIRDHGGEPLELLEILVKRGVDEYDTYRLHRSVELRVRRPGRDEPTLLDFTGSVVELDGQFKLLSYRD